MAHDLKYFVKMVWFECVASEIQADFNPCCSGIIRWDIFFVVVASSAYPGGKAGVTCGAGDGTRVPALCLSLPKHVL